MMALFGIAIVIIATGLELSGKGATLIVDLANRLGESLGGSARQLFLIGAWAAVFSSLVGVWQAVPYLFADFWKLFRTHGRLDPDNFVPNIIDRKGWAYRGYLFCIAFVPMLGLRYDFQLVQKLNSVFGALVMPMLAAFLLILNGRTAWVGESYRNRWLTTLTLFGVLVFFAVIGGPKIVQIFGEIVKDILA
jgi:Mn2+/Fe2+ NRAMP family transporter